MNDQKSKASGAGTGTGPGDGKLSAEEYRKGKRGLSNRDRLFVEHYLSNGGCIRRAALSLGYGAPASTGRRKMRTARVQEYLKRRLDAAGVDPDEVVGSLVTIMRNCVGSSDPAMVLNGIVAASELCTVFGLDEPGRTSHLEEQIYQIFNDLMGAEYD